MGLPVERMERSALKALTWRVLATLVTAGIAWAVTGSLEFGAAVGVADSCLKLVLHYWHDRAWARSPWGMGARPGCVVWLTGLPCSGKTTIAKLLESQLTRAGRATLRLDGDTLRGLDRGGRPGGLNSDLGFSPADRHENLRRIREVAALGEQLGATVLVAAITPYEDDRVAARHLVERFLLVHVATDERTCERRDVKGMWARARTGEIRGFTGLDAPFEPCPSADLVIETEDETPSRSAARVLARLRQEGWL